MTDVIFTSLLTVTYSAFHSEAGPGGAPGAIWCDLAEKGEGEQGEGA